VPEQVDPLQRAAQLFQQHVNLSTDALRRSCATPVRAARCEQLRSRGPMTARNVIEGVLVGRVRALGEARTLEELVGNALERRHDGDDRLPPPRLEQDAADIADRRRGRQGGAAKLENLHRGSGYQR
jgi:hypothetical protein